MASQPTQNSIKVANPDLKNQARTYLTQDVDINALAISVASISGFPDPASASFYVMIGDYGDEKAEIKLITSVSGKDFTIAALTSSHEASDPVTVMDWDQISFYGLTASTATPLSTDTPIETKDIDPTSQFTEYTYSGTTYTYFSSAYYQSTSLELSGFSETVAGTSFTRRSVERIITSASLKALTSIDESPNSRLTWDIALTVLQDGLDEIGAKKKRWSFWNTISTGTSTVANQAYITKPTDLTQLVSIKIDGDRLMWISRNDYNAYTEGTTSTGQPSCFTERNGQYYLHATPDTTYDIEYEYYKIPDVISNMSTEIAIPLVPVLIYYCGAQFAYIRGNEKKGDSLYEMYVRLLAEQVIEYSAPDQDSTPEYIEQTSTLNEEIYI